MKQRSENLKVSSMATLKAYEVQRKRMNEMVRRGRSCEEKIVFLSGAFAVLLKDENFMKLLTLENALKMPKVFRDWIDIVEKAG